MELTLPDAEALIKKLSNNIHRVSSGILKNGKAVTVKVFHYNTGILGEYKVAPEIVIDYDGTIRHVMRELYVYSGMPKDITVKTEKENSGIRCADLSVFGISQKIWGPEEEIKEIVEAVELAKETRETIIGRLKLDGIDVH